MSKSIRLSPAKANLSLTTEELKQNTLYSLRGKTEHFTEGEGRLHAEGLRPSPTLQVKKLEWSVKTHEQVKMEPVFSSLNTLYRESHPGILLPGGWNEKRNDKKISVCTLHVPTPLNTT